ncbi:acyl carrier protein [Kitasatospora sp. NPDC004272]
MTVEQLKAVLATMGTEADIDADTLREEVGLDSLGLAELAEVLRVQHGLHVPEEALRGTVTIGDLAAVTAGAGSAR